MKIQTIFTAGNSQVVAIPKDLAREVGFKTGQKVVVGKSLDGQSVIIGKAQKKVTKTKLDQEFSSWLKNSLQEDGEILDELAIR